MIVVKREFNNGVFDCQEIYDNEHKILETTNAKLWNATEECPIVIPKARRNDYVESQIPVEVEEDE